MALANTEHSASQGQTRTPVGSRTTASATWASRPARTRSAAPLLLLILAAGALTILALAGPDNQGETRLNAPSADPRPINPPSQLEPDELATINLFERCSQSVVFVSPTTRRPVPTIFGWRDVIETGTGSGFIWDRQGHLVTNYHVIEGAQECQVILPDNTAYKASFVGAWADKDIAVLKIDAPQEKLVPIDVGASKDLRVGQKVFAIGNPFGLDFTLTAGIVSALNREIEAVNGRTIQGVIQTDAAINPGNSGGPLLDSAGRLVGMNTAIYSRTGAYAGIGFAVPVDTINRVVPQLIAHGKVIRPGLGVNVAGVEVSHRLGLKGVLIVSVAKGSSAEAAGLRPTQATRDGHLILGDVILKVGDTSTPGSGRLAQRPRKVRNRPESRADYLPWRQNDQDVGPAASNRIVVENDHAHAVVLSVETSSGIVDGLCRLRRVPGPG